ncbi:MAG: helix-turn-helix domain-containing protein [Candidatus Cyclobacteriaceae bacterium M3_2C_046]
MSQEKKLKYTVIKNKHQYNTYTITLEALVAADDQALNDEIELLTLLIEKWDAENIRMNDLDPVQLIKSLLYENELKAKDLVSILDLSKGTVSKILNYQKGLSKDSIRKLSDYFKLSQSAFNRPYPLQKETGKKIGKRKVSGNVN